MAATPGAGGRVGRRALDPRRTRSVLAAAGVGVPLVAVAASALAGVPAVRALLEPGPLTRWGLPLVTGVRDGAATGTVGLLALALLAMRGPVGGGDALDPDRVRVVRWAGTAAAAWAAAAAALVVLTFSDVAGRPVGAAGFATGLGSFVVDVQLGRLLAGGVLLVGFVAVVARRTRLLSTTAVLAVVSAAALLLVALGGHAASEDSHSAAVNTMFVHLLGAATWGGGLVGLVLLRTSGVAIGALARRFSVLAGACFVTVAVSGVWRVLVRVEDVSELAGSYGAILAGKVALLLALGVAGAVHRRRTLPRLAAEPDRWAPFLALVLAEVVLMAVATGLGAALSRTPLP